MTDQDLNLLTILGLELTLEQYRQTHLDGQTPYFEQEPLEFGCTGCGACCTRPGAVFFTPLDIDRLAQWYEVSPEQIREGLLDETEDGEFLVIVEEDTLCPFYEVETDGCIIHPVKPIQCRTYPFWPELVHEKSAWEQEAQHCPGIHQGRSWQPEEVRRLLVGLGDTDSTSHEPEPEPEP